MLKALALDNFWPAVSAARNSPVKMVKKTTAVSSLRLWLGVLLVGLNVVLLASYIYGVNEFADKGYEIAVLQNRLSDLNQSSQKINLQISEAGSMVEIQNNFLSANYVSAGTPKFLQVPQVAER